MCVCVCVHISEHMHTPSTCLCEINMAEVSLNAEQSRFCPSLALRSSETIKLHHSGNSQALRNTNYKSCKLFQDVLQLKILLCLQMTRSEYSHNASLETESTNPVNIMTWTRKHNM